MGDRLNESHSIRSNDEFSPISRRWRISKKYSLVDNLYIKSQSATRSEPSRVVSNAFNALVSRALANANAVWFVVVKGEWRL